MKTLNRLAIFCGSKTGRNPNFSEAARSLGQLLASRKVELVYGGGRNGLMGIVADTCLEGGGTVRGVIPQVLVDWEHQHTGITELQVVEDMHQRKRRLYQLCDGALILPGGFGTLDELFEIVTWNGLSIHDKQIFLLNTDGFYDGLLAHLDQMEREGFLYIKPEQAITVLKSPEELAPYLPLERPKL